MKRKQKFIVKIAEEPIFDLFGFMQNHSFPNNNEYVIFYRKKLFSMYIGGVFLSPDSGIKWLARVRICQILTNCFSLFKFC